MEENFALWLEDDLTALNEKLAEGFYIINQYAGNGKTLLTLRKYTPVNNSYGDVSLTNIPVREVSSPVEYQYISSAGSR